jgi:hypothetical protein
MTGTCRTLGVPLVISKEKET